MFPSEIYQRLKGERPTNMSNKVFPFPCAKQVKEKANIKRIPYFRITSNDRPKERRWMCEGHSTIHHFQTSYYRNWARTRLMKLVTIDDWLKFQNGFTPLCYSTDVFIYIIRPQYNPPIVNCRVHQPLHTASIDRKTNISGFEQHSISKKFVITYLSLWHYNIILYQKIDDN